MTEKSTLQPIKSHTVFQTVFLPEKSPRAIIQINHGLAEHSMRYHEFAKYLCDRGYGVYLHDHPGHGKTAGSNEAEGHLPWKNGWDDMLDVIHGINKSIRKAHPSIPVFLMGHSMGSLLARYYNCTYPMYFKGMILSGTGNPDPVALKSFLALVKTISYFKPYNFKSKWVNTQFYKKFNISIKNSKTTFDWLSSDEAEVEKYINDPLCGFDLSLGFFKNLLQGSLQMLKSEKQLRFRKNFATLIISGTEDPVGNFGKGPKALQQKYVQQGFFNTHLKLLEGRHELLNEKPEIRQQTYKTIEDWIDGKLSGNF